MADIFKPGDLKQLLKGKRVLIIGDSSKLNYLNSYDSQIKNR